MMNLKYITVRDRDEIESAILFPETVIHRDVGRIHSASSGVRVLSAGFVQIDHDRSALGGRVQVTTYGSSESLRMGPRPEDAELIRRDFT